MKNKIYIVLAVILLSLIFSFAGSYLYNKFATVNVDSEKDKALTGLKDSLQLSENQFCKMKECQDCFKDELSQLTCAIHQSRFELVKELREKDQDTVKINKIMDRIDSLQSKTLHIIVNNILDQKNILEDSQKKKFFDMLLSQIANDKVSCMKKHKH